MLRLNNSHCPAHETPFGQRALMCVWLLFFTVFSCAQVMHTHGELLPSSRPHLASTLQAAQLPGEAACPLCVAMHSTLPAAVVLFTFAQRFMLAEAPPPLGRTPGYAAHFALFSRPPPSASNAW